MSETHSPGELSGESAGTKVQTPSAGNPNPEDKMVGYKPVTLRVRPNTKLFFDRIQAIAEGTGKSTADAAAELISELLDAQSGTKEHAEKLLKLESDLRDAQQENERLLKLTEENAVQLKDNEHILQIDPKVLSLLNTIAQRRFANESVRERYKLKEQESAGQLLINCITTQDILFNFNECFYTGLTRKHLNRT